MAARPADGGHPEAFAGPLPQFLDAANALRRVTALVARGESPPEIFSAVAREMAGLLGADVAGLLRRLFPRLRNRGEKLNQLEARL